MAAYGSCASLITSFSEGKPFKTRVLDIITTFRVAIIFRDMCR